MHDLLKTITEHLYEGITSPDDWYAGLDVLRQSTESVLFHHAVWDRREGGITHSISNDALPPEKLREFDLYHAPYDPRIPLIMQARNGEVMLDHEHFTAQDMSRSPIYADWLASLGYRHTLGMVLHDDGNAAELLALLRPVEHSSFEGAPHSLVSQLMPDLLRASRLRVQVADVAAQAALGLAALDALPQALALVDAGGQLHYANRAAQRVLAGGMDWRLHHGRVCANPPATQERLERSVKAACRRPGGAGRAAFPVASTLHIPQNPGAGAAASTLHVLPLHPGHPLARAHWERPHALLVWGRSHAAQRVPELAATLGLTDTEARLALALAQGRSLKDFALAQGCSWHTARTHIKNLMRKTGLHRQQDVAVLVRGLV